MNTDGKLLSTSTDYVIAHQDEFESHAFKNEATAPPSLEVDTAHDGLSNCVHLLYIANCFD